MKLTSENRVGNEWRGRGREREREREREWQINRVRDGVLCVGQKWKRHRSEMAVSENGHLSIFNKANQ